MISLSVLYPRTAGSRFDMDYYLHKHMPVAIQTLAATAGYKGVTVENAISGAAPGSEPAHYAFCRFYYDSVESLMTAFAKHAPGLMSDIPNYTSVEPVLQINDIAISS